MSYKAYRFTVKDMFKNNWHIILPAMALNMVLTMLLTLVAGLIIFAVLGMAYTWKAFVVSYLIYLLFGKPVVKLTFKE